MGKATEYECLNLFAYIVSRTSVDGSGDSGKRVLTMATQPMFNITVRRRVWT